MDGAQSIQGASHPIADQRANPRVPLILPARISVGGHPPINCCVTDLSYGGAGIRYEADPAPAADAVAQLQIAGFGVFDGITIRDAGELRGLRFLQGEAERHKLQEKMAKYIERGLSELPDQTADLQSSLALHRTNGREERCEVLCITLQGVVLATTQRPTLGELVRLGRLYGRVVRHFVEGIGVEFVSFVNSADASGYPGGREHV
jgi:hypothetical protein